MDYTHSMAISAAGMSLERTRVEVAALNIANANTVAGPNGEAFRPLRVVADADFASAVDAGLGVANVRLEQAAATPRMVYEPGHPMADGRGFVAYAGVDMAAEMVSLMSATRSYEANIAAMNTSRNLALKALEIGGNQ